MTSSRHRLTTALTVACAALAVQIIAAPGRHGPTEARPLAAYHNNSLRDFDGDGKTDVGVIRGGGPPLIWYALQSSDGGLMASQWGAPADLRLVGDYDGDGKADLAVYRTGADPGVFYVRRSSDGTLISQEWGYGLGGSRDEVLVGDLDGDGKTDFIVGRLRPPGLWTFYALESTIGFEAIPWGLSGDIYWNVHDYDGDGKDDIAIVRRADIGSGLERMDWMVRRSTGGPLTIPWGVYQLDDPIVGDYDGDGKTDVGVWRFQDHVFYIRLSSTGGLLAVQWGSNIDDVLGRECFYPGGGSEIC